MPEQRVVAGIRCGEVLQRLSDYIDGELTPADAQRIEEHLLGCDWCEQFGGDFATAVNALRRQLAGDDINAESRLRLRERLRR